jgi:hypothetical protein
MSNNIGNTGGGVNWNYGQDTKGQGGNTEAQGAEGKGPQIARGQEEKEIAKEIAAGVYADANSGDQAKIDKAIETVNYHADVAENTDEDSDTGATSRGVIEFLSNFFGE